MSAAENPRAVPGGNNPPSQIDELRTKNADLLARVAPLVEDAGRLPKAIKTEKHFASYGKVIVDATKLTTELEKQRAADKKPHWDAGQAVDAFFKDFKDQLAVVTAKLQEAADAWTTEQRRLERERLAAEAAAVAAREAEERAAARRAEAERIAREAAAPAHASLLDDDDDLSRELPPEPTPAASPPVPDRTPVAPSKVVYAGGLSAAARASWVGEIVDFDKIDLERLRPFIYRDAVEDALKRYVKAGNRQLAGARITEAVGTKFR